MTPLGWTALGAWAGLQIGMLCGLWIATPRRSPDGVVELAKRRRKQPTPPPKDAVKPPPPPAPPRPRFRTILPSPR